MRREFLDEHNLQQSMSRRGNCHDTQSMMSLNEGADPSSQD
jgi:transposase InsO family protein